MKTNKHITSKMFCIRHRVTLHSATLYQFLSSSRIIQWYPLVLQAFTWFLSLTISLLGKSCFTFHYSYFSRVLHAIATPPKTLLGIMSQTLLLQEWGLVVVSEFCDHCWGKCVHGSFPHLFPPCAWLPGRFSRVCVMEEPGSNDFSVKCFSLCLSSSLYTWEK